MIRLINPLNAELNPIRHLLALVGVRHIVHVSRVRVNALIIILKIITDTDNHVDIYRVRTKEHIGC